VPKGVYDGITMKRPFLPLVALLFTFSGPLLAKPLDMDTVLDLLNSGVSEVSIQRFVQRNHFTFHLTADDLKDLKKAGASDQFIEFLQDREGESSASGQAESESWPTEYEAEGADYDVAYASPDVYLGFGFGYPYYYPAYYYPGYAFYYPYPCHYDGGGHHVITGGGSRSGTGVYSYWYRNHTSGRPNPSRGTGGPATTTLTGRILRTPSTSGSVPGVSGSRISSPSRHFAPASPRTSAGGMGGARGSHGGGRGRR